MQFVRIGKYLVNLANVTMFCEQEYDGRRGIRIGFVGGTYERLLYTEEGTEEGYEALKTALDGIPGNTRLIRNALQSKGG